MMYKADNSHVPHSPGMSFKVYMCLLLLGTVFNTYMCISTSDWHITCEYGYTQQCKDRSPVFRCGYKLLCSLIHSQGKVNNLILLHSYECSWWFWTFERRMYAGKIKVTYLILFSFNTYRYMIWKHIIWGTGTPFWVVRMKCVL